MGEGGPRRRRPKDARLSTGYGVVEGAGDCLRHRLRNPKAIEQSSLMRRLFLIRHAKAEPSVGRDDYERRLTDRGRADARRVAAALAARKMLPDLLVHSGAARAKETAEIFAAEWQRQVELIEEAGLYDASLSQLLARTRAPAGRASRASASSATIPGLASWRWR